MKKANNFQIGLAQHQWLRMLLSFCFIFFKFQPDFAYKSVANKKVCNIKYL